MIIMICSNIARLTSAVPTCVRAKWCPEQKYSQMATLFQRDPESQSLHQQARSQFQQSQSGSLQRRKGWCRELVAEYILEQAVPSGAGVMLTPAAQHLFAPTQTY